MAGLRQAGGDSNCRGWLLQLPAYIQTASLPASVNERRGGQTVRLLPPGLEAGMGMPGGGVGILPSVQGSAATFCPAWEGRAASLSCRAAG